jgi:hypothetical protein
VKREGETWVKGERAIRGETRETMVKGEMNVSIEIKTLSLHLSLLSPVPPRAIFLLLFVCLREGVVKGET